MEEDEYTVVMMRTDSPRYQYLPPARPLSEPARLHKLFKGDEVGFERYKERVRGIEQRWDAIGGPARLSRYYEKKWGKFFRRAFVGGAR